MKLLIFAISILIALSLQSCSTCYECTTETALTDATTGDTLQISPSTEEFCTADAEEVNARENDGATCRVQ